MSLSINTRRAFAACTVAALALTACGGNGDSDDNDNDTQEESASGGSSVSGDLEEIYDINPVDRENLQQGGQLTVGVGFLGPQWNSRAQGLASDTSFILEAVHLAGAWTLTPEGEYVFNEPYVLDAWQEVDDDGTQVLHYELNPEAVWNDGTPIDFYTYEHTASILDGSDDEYNLINTNMYDQIASIDMGDDEWSFSVTMEEMYQPWQTIFDFGHLQHPEVDNAEFFNNGFIDDLQSDLRSGPFVVDIYDRAAQVVSLVPNENWWGEQPVLDRLNFARHEQSSDIQAFQNGEIDVVETRVANRVQEMESWRDEGDGYEFRRGQRLFAGGYQFNAESPEVVDVAIREAIFRSLDRQTLVDVRFQNLGWEEETTGSWIALPFQEHFRDDAYPVEDNDPEGAAQVMEEAGYVRDSDDEYFQDPDTGEDVVVTMVTIGSDPTNAAVDQSFQNMVRAAGINLEIENRGSGAFAETIQEGDFSILTLGSGGSPDPTNGANALLSQGPGNNTNIGDDEIDEWLAELTLIEDFEERAARATEIEKEAIARHFHYLGVQNGPLIYTVRSGLANFGPDLFERRDWSIVGWEADAEDDGTDTGVDVDDLEDGAEPEEDDEE